MYSFPNNPQQRNRRISFVFNSYLSLSRPSRKLDFLRVQVDCHYLFTRFRIVESLPANLRAYAVTLSTERRYCFPQS